MWKECRKERDKSAAIIAFYRLVRLAFLASIQGSDCRVIINRIETDYLV